MKTITRAKYLDRIIELNGTPDIKIITGIRRSGKSKLMQAYIAYLKSNFENINIIFIDFMDLAYEEIKEYHALHSYVEEHYQEGKTNYLFVDEVQMCPKFELAINSLYSKGKYDIYVTGSNAFLLSADLATLFTGRYIEIHVFPFSFREYCQFYDDISDKDKLFDEYAIKGGLAGSYAYRTEKDRRNYIKEVYETIVTRDLVQKYALPDTLVLQRLSEFLMDNMLMLIRISSASQGQLVTAIFTLISNPTKILNRHIWLFNEQSALVTTDSCLHAKTSLTMNTMPHNTSINQMRKRCHKRIHTGIFSIFIQNTRSNISSCLCIKSGFKMIFFIVYHITHLCTSFT